MCPYWIFTKTSRPRRPTDRQYSIKKGGVQIKQVPSPEEDNFGEGTGPIVIQKANFFWAALYYEVQ